MDYKLKYLKYKNKYLELKKQFGGVNFESNFCSSEDKIEIDSLNIGDRIKFQFPATEFFYETDFEFKIVNNAGDIPLSDKITLKSVIEKSPNQSVLEIVLNKKERYSKLNFIRTIKPTYTLDRLISIFGCVTEYFKYPKMILEDDAIFYISSELSYRALFYRIFTNKDSIYYGGKLDFKPSKKDNEYYFRDETYTNDKYLVDKRLLYESYIYDFICFYQKVYKIIFNDYQERKIINTRITLPIVLDEINKIIESLKNFGIYQKTTDYVKQLENDVIDIDTKKIINKFMEKLIPSKLQIRACNDAMEKLILSNPLYSAILRIYKAHQYMMSDKVKCTLC